MTPHISASFGDIAPLVVMPGDPRRCKYIAENFLEDAKLVSEVRNIFAYTGIYKGKKVTVMASGMGMPSMGIYSHELFSSYGVDKIIRLGSCKTLSSSIKLCDIIVVSSANTLSNFAYTYDGEDVFESFASEDVVSSIKESSLELGFNSHLGPVVSSDCFYHNFYDKNEDNAIGLEMECFALFYLAKKLGKKSGAILTVSDSDFENKILTPDERELSFDNAIKLALNAIIK